MTCRGNRPAIRHYPHSHGVQPRRHRPANVAVSHDAGRLAADFGDIELFPYARALVADQAAEILGEVKNRTQYEFAQRRS